MSKTKRKPTWYAMYRGDTFIDLGTADYLAEKYHKKKQSLLYLSKPAYHRNAPKNSQRLTLYKMEDYAMKIKSIIKTTKCIYAVSDDVDTIFNKMNEPYFFADTLSY